MRIFTLLSLIVFGISLLPCDAKDINRPHTPEELRQIIENAKKEKAEMYKERNKKLQSKNPKSGKMITRTFSATHEKMDEKKVP